METDERRLTRRSPTPSWTRSTASNQPSRSLAGALIACRTDSQSEDNPEFSPEARRCQEIVADVAGTILAPRSSAGTNLPATRSSPVSFQDRGPGDRWLSMATSTSSRSATRVPGRTTLGRRIRFRALVGSRRGRYEGRRGCALVAMRAIRESGIALAGDLWVHVVADEEVVGQSTRRLLRRLPAVDAVLVAEPTDLAIMPVEGGLVHFRIEIEGRESHAGNRYMSVHAGGLGNRAGVNAIEKMLRVVNALQDLERQWGNLRHHPMLPAGFNTIMPGIIIGGPGGGAEGKLNIISNPGTSPNYCSVEYNLWFLPGESFEAIRDEVEAFVQAVSQTDPWLREHPPRFTWKLRNIYFPPAETSPDHPFIQSLVSAIERAGREPIDRGVHRGVGTRLVRRSRDSGRHLRSRAHRPGAQP